MRIDQDTRDVGEMEAIEGEERTDLESSPAADVNRPPVGTHESGDLPPMADHEHGDPLEEASDD